MTFAYFPNVPSGMQLRAASAWAPNLHYCTALLHCTLPSTSPDEVRNLSVDRVVDLAPGGIRAPITNSFHDVSVMTHVRDDHSPRVRSQMADRAGTSACWERHRTGYWRMSWGRLCQHFRYRLGEWNAGVRDLARRRLRWRVQLRWYLVSLLAPLLIF